MLSIVGLVDGLSAMGVVLFGVLIGAFSIHKGFKLRQKLLEYFGLMIICVGFLYFGPFFDFLFIIFTGENINNANGIYGILSYVWVGPGLILAMYLGAELIIPKKKRFILVTYLILGVFFEFFLFFDTFGMFTFIYPDEIGQELIKSNLNMTSPGFILIAFFLLSVFFFNGFGALYRAFQAVGVLRKKFLLISSGFILFCICSVFNAFLTGTLFYLTNGLMILYTILLYYGVK